MGGMDLAANLEAVWKRIERACEKAGRDPKEVSLTAVSKGHPPEAVAALAAAGHDLFGENRVQEAKAKIPECPSGLRWHMIGHLQTNKARDAVRLFEVVQSVDSLKLARELDKQAEKRGRVLPVLLEVNAAGEASKYGFSPERLLAELEEINRLPRLEIHGLMTMAPWTKDPEKVRPVFVRVRELKKRCEEKLGAPLAHLSMGMSGDFEVAVEEGSTIVRVGTAIFGERPCAWRPRPAAEGG